MCTRDCIFYSVYHDHGASVPTCSRFSSDLASAIKDLEDRCPCLNFITRSIIADLQNCGEIYVDYRRLLSSK